MIHMYTYGDFKNKIHCIIFMLCRGLLYIYILGDARCKLQVDLQQRAIELRHDTNGQRRTVEGSGR